MTLVPRVRSRTLIIVPCFISSSKGHPIADPVQDVQHETEEYNEELLITVQGIHEHPYEKGGLGQDAGQSK